MTDASAADTARDAVQRFRSQKVDLPAEKMNAEDLYERLRDLELTLYGLTLVGEDCVFEARSLELPYRELNCIRKAFGLLIRYDD
jgi:hypothetical protein